MKYSYSPNGGVGELGRGWVDVWIGGGVSKGCLTLTPSYTGLPRILFKQDGLTPGYTPTHTEANILSAFIHIPKFNWLHSST